MDITFLLKKQFDEIVYYILFKKYIFFYYLKYKRKKVYVLNQKDSV
jgi:hypothetical protein